MIAGRQRNLGYCGSAVLQFLLLLLLMWLSADVEAHHKLHGGRQEAVHSGMHASCSHHHYPDAESSGAEHDHGGCIISLFQQGKMDPPSLPIPVVVDLRGPVPVITSTMERPPARRSSWLPYSCGPPA